MKRRKFLKIIGGSTLALGAAGYIYAAPSATNARQPWENQSQYTDPMQFALSHAILAPNPHNRQPWQVEIVSDHEAILYCDPERHLAETDPFDRQITIGLGCFLEVFRLAAAHKGYASQVSLFPEGSDLPLLDTRPVARIVLREDEHANADLFPYIRQRKTDRSPYDNTTPNLSDLQKIEQAAGPLSQSTSSPSQVQALKSICADAYRTEFLTPHAYQESVDLMRIGRKQVRENPDGVSIEGPMIELMKLGGLISKAALLDTNSSAFKQGLKMGLDAIEHSPAFIWITSPNNTREDQIESGHAYVRANLQATALGLSTQPLSQALQEYTEMTEHYEAIRNVLEISAPNCLQMFARIGYGRAKAFSPRWGLETRILKHG